MDQEQLQALLAGCTDHWKREFKDHNVTNWDARHWMSNMNSMLATPKDTPTINLFVILLSEALFTILPGEYHSVKHYVLTHNIGRVHILRVQVFPFDE